MKQPVYLNEIERCPSEEQSRIERYSIADYIRDYQESIKLTLNAFGINSSMADERIRQLTEEHLENLLKGK